MTSPVRPVRTLYSTASVYQIEPIGVLLPSHYRYTGHVFAPVAPLTHEPDPVIEAYKAGIDRTLIRARLDRTPAERVEDLVALVRFAEELARAGSAARAGR